MDKLHAFLKPIMWRNTKVAVSKELQLPDQIDKEQKLLHFSAVEATFYRKQHEKCSVCFLFLFSFFFFVFLSYHLEYRRRRVPLCRVLPKKDHRLLLGFAPVEFCILYFAYAKRAVTHRYSPYLLFIHDLMLFDRWEVMEFELLQRMH